MSKLRLSLLSGVFFFLVFAAVFVAAELLLRYFILKDVTESRDHVCEVPYMPAKFRSHYSGVLWEVPFTTNQYGFRDESDFDKEPAVGEYRILSLGDSIGFGLGIPAQDHYTQVAERSLNALGTPRAFHIVNAAGQGYSPSNYYVYLRHEGLELQPHMVIADMEMCTVISNEALLRWELDPENSAVPRAIRGGRYLVSWDGRLLATCSAGGYFFEKTYVYTVLLRRFLNLMYRISPPAPFRHQNRTGVSYYHLGFDRYLLDEERLESGWEKTFGSLRAMHALLEAKGIPFLLMIMPSRYMFDDDAGPWRDYAWRLMERGVNRARELAIPHIDFTESVQAGGGESLYFDFAHMTSEGNRVVGETLFQHLARELRSGQSPPKVKP